ncbi:hypothetical protein J6590_051582 [Homalodisca vitripennis]|nr:hypothetical protein J6590_051582 [Homalodisca vitripennis]
MTSNFAQKFSKGRYATDGVPESHLDEDVPGSDVHGYNTRGRDNLRVQSQRTMAYEQLSSQVGVKVINRLPECIKELVTKKRLKLD